MADDKPKEASSRNVLEDGSSKLDAGDFTSLTSATNDNNRVFDFFGLPRELRDKIYDQPTLLEHQQLPALGSDGINFLMKAKKLRTSLLLINRQFEREYRERCSGRQALCLQHYPGTIDHIDAFPALRKARNWNIDFSIVRRDSDSDSIEASGQIESLGQFLCRWAPRSYTFTLDKHQGISADSHVQPRSLEQDRLSATVLNSGFQRWIARGIRGQAS